MSDFLDKFIFRSNNLDYVSREIRNLTSKSSAQKIFDAVNSFSSDSEIRYVGGCIRKIINKEKVDDIDLATNLEPSQVCEALKKKDIKYYKTGVEHGTVTAIINENKFEITTLREDISTDGRHADVSFSKNWNKDAFRRDFTINAIYSDDEGNLYDPHNGKKDLENGIVNFIGDANKRIKEDYLRILRYLRFFLNYSKQPHNSEIIKKIKTNIEGVSNLSKERLFDELKKISKLSTLEKLSKDKFCIELMVLIFPELKNIKIFSELDENKKEILKNSDFIFFLSLMIIDETDNPDYFFYKYNVSKKDQKRIKIIDNFYKKQVNIKIFSESEMNKIFYFCGKQAIIDILNFKIIKSKKININLLKLIDLFKKKEIPKMPIDANKLMTKYKIPESKQLGIKLKEIENEWVGNNFQISNERIENIIKN